MTQNQKKFIDKALAQRTGLEKYIMEDCAQVYLGEDEADMYISIKWVMEEVLHQDGGMLNGIVGPIYYVDAHSIYEKYEDDIWELIYNRSVEASCSILDCICQSQYADIVGSQIQLETAMVYIAYEEILASIDALGGRDE